MTTIIPFFPKFDGLADHEMDAHISTYRRWLDQHGDYGKLYMLDIGKHPEYPNRSIVLGVKIYDPEIATLFKLMHEV